MNKKKWQQYYTYSSINNNTWKWCLLWYKTIDIELCLYVFIIHCIRGSINTKGICIVQRKNESRKKDRKYSYIDQHIRQIIHSHLLV